MEKMYAVKEIATLLEVPGDTVKKYSQALEAEGYFFNRNEQNHRVYTDKDMMTLRELVEVKNNKQISLKSAARQVMFAGDDLYVEGATQPLHVQLQAEMQAQKDILLMVLDELLDSKKENKQLLTAMERKLEDQKQISHVDLKEAKRMRRELEETNVTIQYFLETMEAAATKKKKWPFWRK